MEMEEMPGSQQALEIKRLGSGVSRDAVALWGTGTETRLESRLRASERQASLSTCGRVVRVPIRGGVSFPLPDFGSAGPHLSCSPPLPALTHAPSRFLAAKGAMWSCVRIPACAAKSGSVTHRDSASGRAPGCRLSFTPRVCVVGGGSR